MLFTVISNHAQHNLADGFTSEDPATLPQRLTGSYAVRWADRLGVQKLW